MVMTWRVKYSVTMWGKLQLRGGSHVLWDQKKYIWRVFILKHHLKSHRQVWSTKCHCQKKQWHPLNRKRQKWSNLKNTISSWSPFSTPPSTANGGRPMSLWGPDWHPYWWSSLVILGCVTQIHKDTNTQIQCHCGDQIDILSMVFPRHSRLPHSNAQIHKYTNTQIHKYTNTMSLSNFRPFPFLNTIFVNVFKTSYQLVFVSFNNMSTKNWTLMTFYFQKLT